MERLDRKRLLVRALTVRRDRPWRASSALPNVIWLSRRFTSGYLRSAAAAARRKSAVGGTQTTKLSFWPL